MATTKAGYEEYKRVESVLIDLLHSNPTFTSCGRVRTTETVSIESLIKKREEELAKDSKLAGLKEKLAKAKKDAKSQSDQYEAQVKKLINKLKLRGVTPKLIEEIEEMSKISQVKKLDYDCE